MATYYIATTGNNTTGDGSIGNPWATFQKAADSVSAGDTVYARGGTYAGYWSSSANGTIGSPITFSSYAGETAIIDGAGPARDDGSLMVRINGDYTILKNLELTNAANQSLIFFSGADYCTADTLVIHDSYRQGINFYRCVGGTAKNCLIYNCYDYNQGGGNADGIDCADDGPGTQGSGHTFMDNIIHDCSDDGIDPWRATGCTMLRNICYHNGFIPGTETAAGNGNGFKLGPGGGHTVTDNVAWDNRVRGFDDNGGSGITALNNTSIDNGPDGGSKVNYQFTTATSTLTNNISYRTNGTNGDLLTGATQTTNSWNLSITEPNFVQITNPLVNTFARLQAGSPAIDVGTTVGGSNHVSIGASDLGAFEYEPPSSSVVMFI